MVPGPYTWLWFLCLLLLCSFHAWLSSSLAVCSTHDIPYALERPSRSSSTTLFQRTSVFTSAIFGNPYYWPKDLLYPPFQPPSPPCLLTTDSVQWAHAPPPPPPPPSIPVPPVSARFNALMFQHPIFAWSSSCLLKQQHLPESGILLMTIRAYCSIENFTWCHRKYACYCVLYSVSHYLLIK